VSFRRSGGLFVVLRNRQNLGKLVRAPDQIGHSRRTALNREFDDALPSMSILSLPRSVLVELSALDGAVVVDNQGNLLAYGAVLTPEAKGRADAAEGSRSKAAIGASNYGLAVKISAHGDIAVFVRGREFIKV
jgi:DNA integrity scanning protein DisA with diadenylate cyclase activity